MIEHIRLHVGILKELRERKLVRSANGPAGDVVELSAIDADAGVVGDQAFRLAAGFTGRAGEAALSYDGVLTRLALDADGDAGADAVITMNGDQTAFMEWVL